jgi:hypothetical protein
MIDNYHLSTVQGDAFNAWGHDKAANPTLNEQRHRGSMSSLLAASLALLVRTEVGSKPTAGVPKTGWGRRTPWGWGALSLDLPEIL